MKKETNVQDSHVSRHNSNEMLAEAVSVKPILFSTPMVKAILEGRKTQTRRIIKVPKEWDSFIVLTTSNPGSTPIRICEDTGHIRYENTAKKIPYVKGDILWVRETWRKNDTQTGWYYYEDDSIYSNKENEKWKPSIFMPKEACRIFLKIINVGVERLQDMSKADAKSEGVELLFDKQYSDYLFKNYESGVNFYNPKLSFQTLWQKINGRESWESNPFVWVIEFERCERPGGFC